MIKKNYLIPITLALTTIASPAKTPPEYMLGPQAISYLNQRSRATYTNCPELDAHALAELASHLSEDERAQIDRLMPATTGQDKERVVIAPAEINIGKTTSSIRWPSEIRGDIARQSPHSSTFTVSTPLLEGRGTAFDFSIKGMQYQTVSSCPPMATQRIQSQFTAKQLSLLGKSKQQVLLKNFKLRSEEQQDGDFIGSSTNISADALLTAMPFKLGRIETFINLEHLYAPALRNLQANYSGLAIEQNLSNEEKRQNNISWLSKALALIEYNPKLSLEKLYIETQDKGLIISGNLALTNLEKIDAEQPANLLNKLNGTLHVTVNHATLVQYVYWQTERMMKDLTDSELKGLKPKDIKRLADNMLKEKLETFSQRGLITIEKDRISADLTLSNGELKVNGQNVPLPDFSQIMGTEAVNAE